MIGISVALAQENANAQAEKSAGDEASTDGDGVGFFHGISHQFEGRF